MAKIKTTKDDEKKARKRRTLDEMLLGKEVSGNFLREKGFTFNTTFHGNYIFQRGDYNVVCSQRKGGKFYRKDNGRIIPEDGIYKPWASYNNTWDDFDVEED